MILQMIKRAVAEVESLLNSPAFNATGNKDADTKAELAAALIGMAAQLDPSLTAERGERLYTATEAAALFGVSKGAVLARVRDGKLPYVITGAVGQRQLYIPESAFVGQGTARPITDEPDAVAGMERLYTVKEAAQILGVWPNWVYKLTNSGQLRYVLIGSRAKRIPKSAIEEYLNR